MVSWTRGRSSTSSSNTVKLARGIETTERTKLKERRETKEHGGIKEWSIQRDILIKDWEWTQLELKINGITSKKCYKNWKSQFSRKSSVSECSNRWWYDHSEVKRTKTVACWRIKRITKNRCRSWSSKQCRSNAEFEHRINFIARGDSKFQLCWLRECSWKGRVEISDYQPKVRGVIKHVYLTSFWKITTERPTISDHRESINAKIRVDKFHSDRFLS